MADDPDLKPAPVSANAVARLLQTLRVMERMPLADLVLAQARLIEKVVRHARGHVPFHKGRLDVLFDADDVMDLSRWAEVPILSGSEARENADALKARAVPTDAGYPVQDRTSGSGGDVFHFLRSEPALIADSANSLRIFQDHRFDPEGRFADIRLDVHGLAPYPDGLLRPGWSFGTARATTLFSMSPRRSRDRSTG